MSADRPTQETFSAPARATSSTPLARRVLAAAISTVLALACAWWFLSERKGPPRQTVEMVDRSEEFAQALAERRSASGVGEGTQTAPDEPTGLPSKLLYEPEDKAEMVEFVARMLKKGMVSDPVTFMRRASNMKVRRRHPEYPGERYEVRTNSLGFRNDREVLSERPALRVLVTGDSQTEGVCPNEHNLCARLEELFVNGSLPRRDPGSNRPIDVEVLNAGVGSYNPYHYLGVAERHLPTLKPHYFVVLLFGGNDFNGAVSFQRFFARGPMYARKPYDHRPLGRAGVADDEGLVSQMMGQVIFFLNNPATVPHATRIVDAIATRIAELCAEHGTTPIFVYLPPSVLGQPQRYAELQATIQSAMEIEHEEVAVSDRIADEWLASLADQQLEAIDLRPTFAQATERLYWAWDGHLNIEGNLLVAQLLHTRILALQSK